MLKRIKTLLKGNILFLAIAFTIGILYLSLIKSPNIGVQIKNIDKLYHCFAYFMLTLSWLIYYYKQTNKKYIVVICCILFGILIEVLQKTITNYRTGDLLDVFANSLGAIIALLLINVISKKNNIN